MKVQVGLVAAVFGVFMPTATACGGYRAPMQKSSFASLNAASGSAPVTVVASADASRTAIPEQLVVEGSLSVEVDQVTDIVDALRSQIDSAGGRVVLETVNGAETSWYAEIKIRVPPAAVDTVVKWLASRGTITDKRITANDVSKELFDQDLEIANQQAALDRLTKLMEQGGLAMADILSIEKEMSRIRGRIDELRGATRFTKDRVAYATLDVSLRARSGAVHMAKAKAYPGVRGAMMYLVGAGERPANRYGAGFVIHPAELRTFSIEVDVFGAAANAAGDTRSRAVLASIGGAFYSDFLGHGKRQFLNPYIGFRSGYAYLDSSRFLSQFEAGIELVKTKHLVIDASVRATALIGNTSDLAVVPALGAVAAF